MRVTVPCVTGFPPEVTVAVNVTESPTNEGSLLEVTVVVEAGAVEVTKLRHHFPIEPV
jgi:hypothetical protein